MEWKPPTLVARAFVAALVAMVLLCVPASAAPAANDPVFVQGLQWALQRIDAPAAWSVGRGAGVTIAIIDSGVDLSHEDLAGKIVAQTSCIGAEGNAGKCHGTAQDDNGHGTHVAGIAAADTDNGKGIAGVAPDAKLMAVRVLRNECASPGDCQASGTSGDVAAGIRWATDHGADVINLSLGGGTLENALGCSFCDAIDYAWSKGVVSVIAAGNDSILPAGFGDEPAIVVTATTRDDTRASYSNSSSGFLRTARWPLAAPGGEGESNPADCATGGNPKGVLSTYWIAGHHNEYACLAGTSMAAPHVSGAIALLLGKGLKPQAAVERLIATAHDLGAPGRDPSFGFGLIDVAKAMGPAPGTVPTTAAPSTSTTAHAGDTTTLPPLTTVPPGTAPTGPSIDTPTTGSAAPLTTTSTDDSVPAWLAALAIALAAGSASGAAAVGWATVGRTRPPRRGRHLGPPS